MTADNLVHLNFSIASQLVMVFPARRYAFTFPFFVSKCKVYLADMLRTECNSRSTKSENALKRRIEKKTENKEYTGVVAVCINCGRYFYRKRGNQMYCRRKECQSARKAKNQKDKRARDRLEKANESE